jgi:hypothetical protein
MDCHNCYNKLLPDDAVIIEGITIMNEHGTVSLEPSDVQLDKVVHHECDEKGPALRIKEDTRMDEDRYMEMVLARGLHEFWNVVAKAYPLCKTGDMAPDQEIALEQASRDAIMQWIRNNSL